MLDILLSSGLIASVMKYTRGPKTSTAIPNRITNRRISLQLLYSEISITFKPLKQKMWFANNNTKCILVAKLRLHGLCWQNTFTLSRLRLMERKKDWVRRFVNFENKILKDMWYLKVWFERFTSGNKAHNDVVLRATVFDHNDMQHFELTN